VLLSRLNCYANDAPRDDLEGNGHALIRRRRLVGSERCWMECFAGIGEDSLFLCRRAHAHDDAFGRER
jgi:hypothetical protein